MSNEVGIRIEVFDRTLYRKGFYQSGSGELIGCEFVIDESGGRSFTLRFSNYVNIGKQEYVKIKLFNATEYLFMGVVRTIPIRGSTNLNYEYSGFGLNDYLTRLNTEARTYTNETVSDIVENIIDNIIDIKSPIIKNAAKLDTIDILVTEVNFKFISVKEALDQLRKIANSDGNEYVFGVDSDGEFFFKARDTDIKATLTVGTFGDFGIADYSPTDSYEEISILHVLKKDGTYYNSYYSLEAIDIYEKKLTAPDIDDDDLDNWADGQLLELEQPQRQATIEWEIEKSNPTLLIADGTLRIISMTPPTKTILEGNPYGSGVYGSGIYGGEQSDYFIVDDTLKIKEVAYKVDKTQSIRTIQLGSLPVELSREIIEVNKNIEALRISTGR